MSNRTWYETIDGRDIRRHSHRIEGHRWWQAEAGTDAKLLYRNIFRATSLGAFRAFLLCVRQCPDDYTATLRLIDTSPESSAADAWLVAKGGGLCHPICFAGKRKPRKTESQVRGNK